MRRILSCLLLFIWLPLLSNSDAERLGKECLRAQNLKDITKFKSLFSRAVSQYRNNKSAFNSFLNVRDGYGYTALARAAVILDIEVIVFILSQLESYFKKNEGALDIFNYLNAQGLHGYTAFYLLIENGTHQDVKLMLYHVIRLMGDEKELFFQFLTPKIHRRKWTPLHWLAYQGSGDILETVVKTSVRVLGKNSSLFNAFINAQDVNGATPLALTNLNIRQRKFLMENGATIVHGTKPEIKEAQNLGLSLIDAIQENKFNKVRQILEDAQNKYKEDPHLFLELLTVRNSAGWGPLMYAIVLSYDFAAFIIHTTHRFFKNDLEAFYFFLRTVADDGRGPLITAILQRNFDIVHLLLKMIHDFAPSKHFIYILLNIRTYAKGFTPLLAAVDFSSDRDEFFNMIYNVLNTISEEFGKDSRQMFIFVNTQDDDGFPPLAYASSPKITQILIDYGATQEGYPTKKFLMNK